MRTILGIILLLLVALVAWPQAQTGSVSGSVTDPSGAAVQDAELSVVSVTTGAVRKATSSESGAFVINALDPGEYSLTVKAPGFKSLERQSITLTPSERLSVGVLALQLGEADQQITVSGEGTALETESAERSSAVTSAQTEQLPVYGRAVTSLVAIAPGVVDPIGEPNRSLSGGNATDFNIAGNRTTSNNFAVDGITLTATGGAPNGTFGISMEAVSEVKVLTSNYQAEYGRLAGSNVELVTKSGTREFHGMGMYYMRNEALNANNFFNNLSGLRRPVNRFNAVTYNVGGPVLLPHDVAHLNGKLFFFWNQEYLPQSSTGALQYSTMPTALERTGDFSQSYVGGKLTSVVDSTSGKPFPGNIIPQNRLDPNGQALLNVFPLPNTTSSTGAYNYVNAISQHAPLQMNSLKLDYNIRAADSLAVTLNGNWSTAQVPNGSGGNITASMPLVLMTAQTYNPLIAIHYTHIFSPTTVNELTTGYAGTSGTPGFPDGLAPVQRSTYGFTAGQLNPANNPLNLIPAMTFGGISDAPSYSYDGRFPYRGTRYVTDISDNLSKVIGPHALKIGIFLEHMRQYDGPWASNFTGNFDFSTNANNPLNSGNPFANAALGVFNTYTEATAHPISLIYSNGVDGFAQDNWKVNKKLTLDYGVRFSWYQPFYNYNNEVAGFVPSLYDPAQAVKLIYPALQNGKTVGVNPVTGQTYPSALIGFIAPNTGNTTNGMVVAANTAGYPRALVNDMGPLVAPRFGFAYDPIGDGKTAIRGGWGMFYSRPLGTNSAAIYSFPLVQSPVVQYGTISTFTSAQGFISPPSVVAWQKDMKAPEVMNMSLSVQRNIGFGTVVDIAYVGSLARHLSWSQNLEPVPLGAQFLPSNANPAAPSTPLPNAFLVPIQGYSGITSYADDATSNYHSLQVSANRRFARNVQFGFSWTWSKAMDWTDSDFGAVNNAVPASLFRAWNYGLAGFDRTNLVKINWLWDVPGLKSAIAPVKAVVNDWHVFGIYTYSSGAPLGVGFSQQTATNITGSPSVSARINVLGDPNNLASNSNPLQAFNPTAFALPAVGTLGDPSKVLVRGPGLNNWNISLAKGFPIWERLNLQLRAEFYNAFNHTQFSSINTTALFNAAGSQLNSQFGQYTAAQNPRIIQLAVRLQF